MDGMMNKAGVDCSIQRILVIDDDYSIAELVAQVLVEKSYQVDQAYSGQDGMRLAVQNTPDLIILDVRMPDIDGMEVCRHLRRLGATMPILMLTGLDTVAEKVQGLQAGADDYLPKPFALEELLLRVQVLLR